MDKGLLCCAGLHKYTYEQYPTDVLQLHVLTFFNFHNKIACNIKIYI